MHASVGTTNAEQVVADEAAQAKERLRSATGAAATAARERARQAQDWARHQWSDLQDTVEAQPYRATLWALGIGLAAGILLTSLMRGRR